MANVRPDDRLVRADAIYRANATRQVAVDDRSQFGASNLQNNKIKINLINLKLSSHLDRIESPANLANMNRPLISRPTSSGKLAVNLRLRDRQTEKAGKLFAFLKAKFNYILKTQTKQKLTSSISCLVILGARLRKKMLHVL